MSIARWKSLVVAGAAVGAVATWAIAQDAPPARPPAPPTPPIAGPSAPAPAGETGKLSLSQPEWDFGTKWFGEKCEGEVTLKNDGKGPLTIVNVKTSCGCTAAKPKSGGVWQNKVLQPGESDVLTLTYNTRKAAAKVTQTVTIETNDPSAPSTAFQVKGEVKQLFAMVPGERITFPRIDKDSSESQTIELTSNLPDQKIDLKVKPLDEKARYEIKLETIEEGKKFRLTASTKPPLEAGANATEVLLETGMEQFPEVRIPVTAFVMPRVTVTPNRLFISPKATAPVQRKIKVTYNPTKPLKITELKTEPSSLKAELVPPPAANPAVAGAQGTLELNVTLPVASELPGGKGVVTILTDDPSPEYQRLLVEVQVRDTTPATRPSAAGAGTGTVQPADPAATGLGATPPQPGGPEAQRPVVKPAENAADKPADKPAEAKP